MPAVTFTKNFKDRSTDTAFQFEFFCDRSSGQWMPGWLAYHFPEACAYSCISTAQSYPVGVTNKVKEAASWLSNRFPQVSAAGDAVKTFQKEAWDNAFNAAVQEAKTNFRLCPSCNKWVCAHACFNDSTGTCRACNTAIDVRSTAGQFDKHSDIRCRHCGNLTASGRFCDTCGKPTAISVFCGNCGKSIESDRVYKFCPHCGDSLSYLDNVDKERKEPA